jgi:[acyl-carrier-protein] S-malonyltransferase
VSAGAALLFPGQGAQAVGMGRVAYERSRAARAVFAQAEDTLRYPLSRLCFEGPPHELQQTRRQQPAILSCSLALLAAHDERVGPFQLGCVTGHSLGFYSALVAAGSLPLDVAVRLVALRAELMQRAAEERPGGMAAVLGLDDAAVEAACAAATQGDDVVVAANYNSPGQVVISGACGALARAIDEARKRGARKVVPLPVGGAFHSPLMRSAADAMASALDAAAIGVPACPVIANATAQPLRTVAEIREELRGQILAPVRWTAAMRSMAATGAAPFVDCGPGATLAGLLKRILAVSDQPSAVSSLEVIQLDE